VGLNLPRKLYYEKEIHFQVSRSSGPGRYDADYEEAGLDYPIGYVRWTEGRNLEAFADLLAEKRIDVKPLITHRYPIEQAEKAYELITGKSTQHYMGVIVTYPGKIPLQKSRKIYTQMQPKSSIKTELLSIGVIGSGNYANAVFLPMIKKIGGVKLSGIASANGVNAQHNASRYGFAYASSDQQEILRDKDINLVAVLTRHNQHAKAVIDGLKKGKHVFCEKPIAIKKHEIMEIENVLKKPSHPYLTVGYNRRFSRYGRMVKDFFRDCSEPIYASYRINAGYLPPSHWLHDPDQGGGRLVGEGCHFIDFLCYLVGRIPESVRVISMPDHGKYSKDNFHITMEFPGGSIGTVTYLANGNKSFSKEYLEVFGGGRIARLDDFRNLELCDESASTSKKSVFRQDKGHQTLWSEIIHCIKSDAQEPIPYDDLIQIGYVILACQHALETGNVVDIAEFSQSG
ncbi:MAG TPA: dehydrogenase, partial [Prolixibacteraceae bacterium]|nr:dehydrogenase [Prolixibacteraceae bacterium]